MQYYRCRTANRTNLELKRCSGLTQKHYVLTANRTNLELKPGIVRETVNVENLPIAPIWNWNIYYIIDKEADLYCQSHQSGIETSFVDALNYFPFTANRTNLELKRSHGKEAGAESQAANRTNLELKLGQVGVRQIGFKLPIAPIWNWNYNYFFDNFLITCRCQSHQSGIETTKLRCYRRIST